MESTRKNRPQKELRMGRIKALIWRNERQDGHSVHNVTFSRLYRDGEAWKESTSFGRDDCLLVAQVAQQATAWMYAQREHESEVE